MKRILKYMLISIFLQLAYYFLFIRPNLSTHGWYHNPISIISMIFFLYLFIKESKYSYVRQLSTYLQLVGICLSTVIVINCLLVYLSLSNNILTASLYLVIYDTTTPLYTSSMLTDFGVYHFLILQFIIFFFNVFVIIVKNDDYFAKVRFRKRYRLITLILFLSVISLLFINIHIFYYNIYYITAFFLFWLIMPFFFRLCDAYFNFIPYLCGLIITVMTQWIILNKIVPQLKLFGYYYQGLF
ncbi:MAG: hypothetical protein GX676_07395 [Bacilli bacterium]|nr:hypothetical protein [Bacilli bacterium]